MGKFTDWADGLRGKVRDGFEDSVRFVTKVFSKDVVSDADVDAAAAKAQAAADRIEAILIETADAIPGVPRVAAVLLATVVRAGLQGFIASAAEGAKLGND